MLTAIIFKTLFHNPTSSSIHDGTLCSGAAALMAPDGHAMTMKSHSENRKIQLRIYIRCITNLLIINNSIGDQVLRDTLKLLAGNVQKSNIYIYHKIRSIVTSDYPDRIYNHSYHIHRYHLQI